MASAGNREYKSGLIRWIEYRMPVFSLLDGVIGRDYPTPKNLNYWWNLGSILGLALVIQIATGIFLAMHYIPTADGAFDSVQNIMRNVNNGWLLRYVHANAASLFFVAVYIHIFRAFYYGSYKAPRELLWFLGVFIFVLMMAAAFTGYVLPWGQMSFWAATVITNLFSVIPLVGDEVTMWLWGGFSVGSPTVQRFFSLHYLLPFVIAAIIVLHIWALHVHGSSNPLGINVKGPQDTIAFHPYYTAKDAVGFGVFLLLLAFIVFYEPNYLNHPDNFNPANPLVTPPNIVPEWYFLPFYAILRSMPDKTLGVILFVGSIVVLFLVPFLDTSRVRSAKFRPVFRQFFWIFVADAILLGFVGANPPEGTWVIIGRLATAYYFAHFFLILPFVGWLERPKPLPDSIAQPVLGDSAPEAAE
jgi:quinol-cytochrome oxidoreductase complex cytochrome b subunit